MRLPYQPFTRRQRFRFTYRVSHQRFQRHRWVGNPVDKRGVGAVFQQPAYQISQQRFMGADRRVNPARAVQFAVRHLAHHLLIQGFAHAVQALEFILPRIVVIARQMVDRAERMGVMGGELRIDQVRRRQQAAGAGQIGNIGIQLAGVYRIAFQPVHLGALDFAIPVGAFNQPNHQPPLAAARQIDQRVNHQRTAFLISLNHKTDAVPPRQPGFETQALQ